MASSIRQIFGSDPTPANIGDISGNRFIAVPSSATVSGNTLWCACCIANFASNVITGVSDSVNGSWTQADILNGRTASPGTVTDALSVGSFYFPNASSIPAGFKGTATGGSTTTIVMSGAGWTTNQWAGAKVWNYSNGDVPRTVLSNTATTLTLTTTAFSTASGNSFVIGGWVEIDVSGVDDYDASTIVEVQGVSSSPFLGHNKYQDAFTSGTDNVLGGTAALGSSPCIIIGLSIASENLSSVPAAGTGNTSYATVWKWDQAQFNARIQYRNVSNPGTTGSNFSALSSDFYQTVWVAFADASSGAITGSSSLTFGQSGTLKGSGALAGSSALVIGETGSLKGAGSLGAASALTIGQGATLTAAGILAGASALAFAQTAALTASGALAGSSALTFGASATADLPSGALMGTAA